MNKAAVNDVIDMMAKLRQSYMDATKAQADLNDEIVKRIDRRDNYIMVDEGLERPHYYLQLTRRQAMRLELLAEDHNISIPELVDRLIKNPGF